MSMQKMSDNKAEDKDLLALIRPEIRRLNAYHVPDAKGFIKLDAMENPYSWPDDLIKQWSDQLQGAALNRYPDPHARELTAALRDAFDINDQSAVVLGNGSDELIQLIVMAVACEGATLLAPEPSFSMYRMIADFVGIDYVGVALNVDGFSLDMPAMLAAIDEHQPAVIFLSYPNNPTGNLFEVKDIETILAAAPGVVVVDEAYQAFAETSMMDRLPEYKNLLLLRTLSKMGLAGLRLGVLAGDADWLGEIDKIRLPYNINVLTQMSAIFALQHYDMMTDQAHDIRDARTQMLNDLAALDGVSVYPSQANFILFRVPAGHGVAIFEAIKGQGVLIKNLHTNQSVLSDCLRVTVGKPDENKAFMAALSAAL